MLDDVEVVVAQHFVFECIVFMGKKLAEIKLFLFAEIVEYRRIIGRAGVKRALYGLRRAILIFHVVGEDHQLRDVDKTPEFWIAAARDDAVALSQHAFAVIGLFDLDKRQRHAIDEQGDVWAELFIAIFARQFGDHMEAVVLKIFKINQPNARALAQPVVKSLAKVFVI